MNRPVKIIFLAFLFFIASCGEPGGPPEGRAKLAGWSA